MTQEFPHGVQWREEATRRLHAQNVKSHHLAHHAPARKCPKYSHSCFSFLFLYVAAAERRAMVPVTGAWSRVVEIRRWRRILPLTRARPLGTRLRSRRDRRARGDVSSSPAKWLGASAKKIERDLVGENLKAALHYCVWAALQGVYRSRGVRAQNLWVLYARNNKEGNNETGNKTRR